MQQIAPPASLAALGYGTLEQARKSGRRTRRLMIATEGASDTGKTEFLLTCPGPGAILMADRGFDALCDNPTPPPTRRSDMFARVVRMPAATQFRDPKDYLVYWLEYLQLILQTIALPEITTLCVDGDNVTWECQRLAEHGKLTGIFPQTKYTDVYAARRALNFRIWESGKIVVMTNMMRDEFKEVFNADGSPVIDPQTGEIKKVRTGNKVAQGFPDQDYLWQIRLRHLYEPPRPSVFNSILKRMTQAEPARWGVRIMKCKVNPQLVGSELWGEQATFRGVVEHCYPHIDPREWGL